MVVRQVRLVTVDGYVFDYEGTYTVIVNSEGSAEIHDGNKFLVVPFDNVSSIEGLLETVPEVEPPESTG